MCGHVAPFQPSKPISVAEIGPANGAMLLDCYPFLSIQQYLHCYQYITNWGRKVVWFSLERGGGVVSGGSVGRGTGLGVVRVGTALCQWVVRVGTTMQVGSVKD